MKNFPSLLEIHHKLSKERQRRTTLELKEIERMSPLEIKIKRFLVFPFIPFRLVFGHTLIYT